jgi:predicted outer membrane lipoprotein
MAARPVTYEGFCDSVVEARLEVPLFVPDAKTAGVIAAIAFEHVENLARFELSADTLVLFVIVEEGQSIADLTAKLEPVLKLLNEAEFETLPPEAPTP